MTALAKKRHIKLWLLNEYEKIGNVYASIR